MNTVQVQDKSEGAEPWVVTVLTRIKQTRFLQGHSQFGAKKMFPSDKIQVVKAINIEEGNRLSTGSANLDKLLHGGLPNEGLVEITGESGCGKSQLCMQLTLTVQYPVTQGGFHGGAIYICTEERFQSKRLYQLIENFPKSYYRHENNSIDYGDNILVVHVNDFENLEKCLKKVPAVIVGKKVKLIIIDSITAVFRGNYEASEYQKKVRDLRVIGSLLHALSMNHKLLIVCVNQVTQSLTQGESVPALGLAWANMVTTRLLLKRTGSCRFMQVLYSPELPSKVVAEFSVQTSGIQ